MTKINHPPLFIFVGHSGSGKTTFIERLIPELNARNLRIATIKHAHHKVTLDNEGKDSARYSKAGAEMSLLLTTDALQLVAKTDARRSPKELAARFLGEADLILAEGFSHAIGEKIEVFRAAVNRPPRCELADNLIAMISDSAEAHPSLPHFSLDGIKSVADFLIARALLQQPEIQKKP